MTTVITVLIGPRPTAGVVEVGPHPITVLSTAQVGPRGPVGATGATGAAGPAGPAGTIADEDIDDRVATLLVAGTNVTLTYNDAAGTLTIDAAGGGGGLTQEQAEDIVAALIDDNSDLDWTYDDVAGSLVAVIKAGAVTETMLAFAVATQAELDAEASARAAGDALALAKAANLSDLANAGTARTNLGLGTAATAATGDFDPAGSAAAAQAASQPVDSDLTAIALLATTAFGRDFLTRVDAAGGRTYLGLGTAAVEAAATLLARANHTGTQLAATVSDFDTQVAVTAILKTLVDAAGDLLVGTADNTIARKAAGTNGQRIIADSAQSDGLKWVSDEKVVRVVLDGGGAVLTTGAKKVYVTVPFDGTITKARLLADVSGSIVVDVWKDTYANYPPTVAGTITASAKPTITTATKSEDSTLTGWSTTVTAGDIIEVNVNSVTSITKVALDLFIRPR